MKTATFFNPKGGVGKSLHTTMFASWLTYSQGARVLVFDGENEPRLINDRKDEMVALMTDPESPLARYLAKNPEGTPPYEIRRLGEKASAYTKEFTTDLLNEQIHFLMDAEKSMKYDYILYDFPALAMGYAPSYAMMVSGCFDLIFMPIDTNKATWREALDFGGALQKNGVKPVLFWNRVTAEEIAMKGPTGTGLLDGLSAIFASYGFEVMPEKVRSFVKAGRDSNTPLFVRSTVCWPQRYVELNCPYLLDFYKAVKQRLDNA